ncbi:Methyltransferase-like protein 22 [Tetrabaena socialis]|uniref:Methyltransferase-like protein 22 n=1 Tax=Tetrabaena socialis TaxID=47790 RepID=A0A2J8A0N1_9CHLO|nr:Methyltransferase-like protein 22 [Tetrabaena socialis]|eukprot:PNH06091.1 Methyltransferase-like protein 22 [Tetrabaena socialis]
MPAACCPCLLLLLASTAAFATAAGLQQSPGGLGLGELPWQPGRLLREGLGLASAQDSLAEGLLSERPELLAALAAAYPMLWMGGEQQDGALRADAGLAGKGNADSGSSIGGDGSSSGGVGGGGGGGLFDGSTGYDGLYDLASLEAVANVRSAQRLEDAMVGFLEGVTQSLFSSKAELLAALKANATRAVGGLLAPPDPDRVVAWLRSQMRLHAKRLKRAAPGAGLLPPTDLTSFVRAAKQLAAAGRGSGGGASGSGPSAHAAAIGGRAPGLGGGLTDHRSRYTPDLRHLRTHMQEEGEEEEGRSDGGGAGEEEVRSELFAGLSGDPPRDLQRCAGSARGSELLTTRLYLLDGSSSGGRSSDSSSNSSASSGSELDAEVAEVARGEPAPEQQPQPRHQQQRRPQCQGPKRKRAAPAGPSNAAGCRVDSSGDLSPPRRRRRERRAARPRRFVTLRHGLSTTVADVGLQVWRGACLLYDWLLAQPPSGPGCLARTLVLELGGGAGLGGVAAAAVAGAVAVSDVHAAALALAEENIAANAGLVAEVRARREQRRRQRWEWGLRQGSGANGGGVEPVARVGGGEAARDSQAAEDADAEEGGMAAAAVVGGAAAAVGGAAAVVREAAGIGEGEATAAAVSVVQLDWMDFLAYGSGAASVESIMAALVGEQEGGGGGGGGGSGGGSGGLAACGASGGLRRLLRELAEAESVCLVAADTVYDSALNEGLAKCAATLMSYRATAVRRRGAGSAHGGGGGGAAAVADTRLVMACEKRYVFTVADMAVTAPAYDDFMSYVVRKREGTAADAGDAAAPGLGAGGRSGGGGGTDGTASTDAAGSAHCVGQGAAAVVAAAAADVEARRPLFRGRRLDVSAVPQALQYDRCDELELWELSLL